MTNKKIFDLEERTAKSGEDQLFPMLLRGNEEWTLLLQIRIGRRISTY